MGMDGKQSDCLWQHKQSEHITVQCQAELLCIQLSLKKIHRPMLVAEKALLPKSVKKLATRRDLEGYERFGGKRSMARSGTKFVGAS